METLNALSLEVKIRAVPDEVPNPSPFAKDHEHAAYDPVYANRHWRILVQTDRVFRKFRSRFTGKASPVHFFWGSFDFAVTRFSGRPTPARAGADEPDRVLLEFMQSTYEAGANLGGWDRAAVERTV